jgi:creatinine amidohydrolase
MAHPTRALPKRDWLDMTWQDIAGAKTEGWIAVLPLAAVEQHGPHLPLGVDSYIADAYLERAREMVPDDLPVTFLPIQRIGVSTEHLAYPGTLTVSAQTAIAAWTELGNSVARAGVRKLVLVSSHGGNVAAMELVARDLRARFGMLAITVGWHRFGYPAGAFSSEEKKHGIHAGDIETSLMLAAKPGTVQMDKAIRATPATVAMAQEFKWLGAYRPDSPG